MQTWKVWWLNRHAAPPPKKKKTNIWDLTLQPYKYYLNYWYKNTESFSTHDSTHTNSPMLKTAVHKYKSSYFIV